VVVAAVFLEIAFLGAGEIDLGDQLFGRLLLF
jgi:hypothetical protein